MTRTPLVVFGIVLLFIILMVPYASNRLLKPTLNTPLPSDKSMHQKVISWIPYWDQENALASFQNNVDVFDYVSLFWYRLDQEGNIITYEQTVEDKGIIDFAHKHNVKVFALIANLPDHTEGEDADWDYRRVDLVISSPERRKSHIEELVALVKENNFDGLDIDYEALKKQQREDFSLFIEELGAALHKENKLLGVAIHPKTAEYLPKEDNGSHAQDLERIADAADQMYFMTYLEHGTFSGPGSIGSIPWITNILHYAVNELKIPGEKIFLGIGLVGVEWKKDANGTYSSTEEDITYSDILKRTRKASTDIAFDRTSGSVYLKYNKNNAEHIVWFENAKSVEEKLQLAEEYGVGGLAFWRLGNEDQDVWSIIRGQQ